MQVESLNGVATQINNVDITNLSDSDADKIKNILRKDLIVVLKHQERLPYWFVNFVERIGTVANYRQMIYTKEGEFYIGKTPPNTNNWDKDKELYPIQRTTAKKNKKGISTGISAYDRAKTIKVAINTKAKKMILFLQDMSFL